MSKSTCISLALWLRICVDLPILKSDIALYKYWQLEICQYSRSQSSNSQVAFDVQCPMLQRCCYHISSPTWEGTILFWFREPPPSSLYSNLAYTPLNTKWNRICDSLINFFLNFISKKYYIQHCSPSSAFSIEFYCFFSPVINWAASSFLLVSWSGWWWNRG